MPRLFGSKKDLKEGPVEATVPKKLFHLFRRGPQPETTNLPEQPSHRLASWKRIAPEPKKKKSYRISVYETSNESRTPSLQSTDGSDKDNLVIRRGFMERIPSTNSHSSGRTRSQSLDRNWRDETTTRGRAPPSRCVPESVKLGPPVRIPPVHEGILKPLAFSPTKRSSFRNQEMVNAFDLDIARNATSLTDNMSAASSEDQPYLEPRPSPGATGSPSTKRAVSFSKDVQDPKPKPPGSKAMCLGTGTSRRTLRRRGEFSLSHEFEDLCYDLTYFFRCFAEDQQHPARQISNTFVPTIPDDDQTNDSSTFDRTSSLASASLAQSEASI